MPGLSDYEVSAVGEVRRATGGRGTQAGRLKRLCPGNHGYMAVTISVQNSPYTFLVHRLVAAAFLGGADGREVNHKNLNKHDNRVENLEYVSRSENLLHRSSHGIGRGENNASARLTSEQVLEIRARHPTDSYRRLGTAFGIRPETVRDIVKRRIWRHL